MCKLCICEVLCVSSSLFSTKNSRFRKWLAVVGKIRTFFSFLKKISPNNFCTRHHHHPYFLRVIWPRFHSIRMILKLTCKPSFGIFGWGLSRSFRSSKNPSCGLEPICKRHQNQVTLIGRGRLLWKLFTTFHSIFGKNQAFISRCLVDGWAKILIFYASDIGFEILFESIVPSGQFCMVNI